MRAGASLLEATGDVEQELETKMRLAGELDDLRRAHVEGRLQTNLMAWLTTISPSGRPHSVPVWFLVQDDDTILIYSQPGKAKLRNIDANPHVALGLDVTDIGRDVIRFEGTASHAPGHPPANEVPAYLSKYVERIAAIFGTPDRFARSFSEAILITPTHLHA
jgi:PPOX class probable F420-dependent enzyme